MISPILLRGLCYTSPDLSEIVPTIDSTNAALLARLRLGEGLAENDWLIADRQTAGRGRAGRIWFDGYGNFMGSTVALLRPSDTPAHTLSLVAGLAVYRSVAQCYDGPDLFLKWPNDVLLGGAKLCGVLLERQGDVVVVGIGVNIAAAPVLSDRQTTCLHAQGCSIDRDAFAHLLASEWRGLLARWHRGEWPALRAEWLACAHPKGTMVSVKDADYGLLIGTFAGLGDDGSAFLRLADGSRRVIHAGEIEMVGNDASGG